MAMTFRFPLEALRKLRQSEERQQELRLQDANQRVAALELQITEAEAQIRRAEDAQLRKLESRVTASELQFDLLCRRAAREREFALLKELLTATALRDKHRESFRKARHRREVLDSLRSCQLQAYRREENRQEQRRADETFLLRGHRLSEAAKKIR
jgi:flagellar export protein FliJ